MSEKEYNPKNPQVERGVLPPMPEEIFLAKEKKKINWKRIFFILLGVFLFLVVYFSPPWPHAIDPQGQHFELTHEGKAAVGLFLLASIWWVFEVLPIGVTAIAIGALQVLFLIYRIDEDGKKLPITEAFRDFMDSSVWFIFGSLVIGLVFTKTGLTRRLAYKMLAMVGEKTSMIYLGCMLITAALTHIMAHTAVAATIFPLLMAINSLYSEDEKPTKFGKGLFIGMAYVAGAGSIITLLGAARGAVAIGFFRQFTGKEISFFGLTYYMFPIGWVMVFLLWGLMMVLFRPEKSTIPGIRERAKSLYARLGKISKNEIISLLIIGGAILFLSFTSFIPPLKVLNKSAIMLIATVLFFILNILDVKDLEEIPWNIILLFGGAMSIGYCLWMTGAAKWLAVEWLAMFVQAPKFVFIMSIAIFVLLMTNFIMNVAAIAISLPVALVIAKYLGVAAEVILFASLTTAGMPFLLLIGAAPNAIAYGSGQFTSGEFFRTGIIASILLMGVLAVFVQIVWPLMGMSVYL